MPTLRDFLQKINIRAEVTWDEPMSLHTTFKIGGPAEAFVRPAEPHRLPLCLAAARAEGIPLFVLGGGANILVGDKGIRGIVMDTSRLRSVERRGQRPGRARFLVAGAGLSMDELCLEALARGLGGLEDFAGMPGIGGRRRLHERPLLRARDVAGPRLGPSADDRGPHRDAAGSRPSDAADARMVLQALALPARAEAVGAASSYSRPPFA